MANRVDLEASYSADGTTGVAMHITRTKTGTPANATYHWFSTSTLEDLKVEERPACSSFLALAKQTLFCDPANRDSGPVQQFDIGVQGQSPLCASCGGVPLTISTEGVLALGRSDHAIWLVNSTGKVTSNIGLASLAGSGDAASSTNSSLLAIEVNGSIPGSFSFRRDPHSQVLLFRTSPVAKADVVSFAEIADRSTPFLESWPEVRIGLSASGHELAVGAGFRVYAFAVK